MAYENDIGLEDDLPVVTPKLRTAEELAAEFPLQRTDLVCADCGAALVLKDGKYGIFYGCVRYAETGCKGTHNCHKTNALPLGVPANAVTRKARREAHEWLEKALKTRSFKSREDAYRWLSEALDVPFERCHLAAFDLAMCGRTVAAVRHRLGDLTRFDRDDVV